MIKKALLFSAAMLTACGGGLTEDEYLAEGVVVTCDKLFECNAAEDIAALEDLGLWFFGADSAECQSILNGSEDDTATTTSECVNFNAEAAELCLEGWRSMSCDDLAADVTPEACNDVCEEASDSEDTSAE